MSKLVNPHGSDTLKPLLLSGQALADEKKRAAGLPKVKMSSRETGDVIMMGIGGFTPLMAMLTSCAGGITVVNIDNGFGAGLAGLTILQAIERGSKGE